MTSGAIVLAFADRRVRVFARTSAGRPVLERVAMVFAHFRADEPADVELAAHEAGDDPAGRTVLAVSAAALASAPPRWAVHAAACVWRERTILLPGGSGCGKSTLVAHLVARGATLLSDDVAWLEPPSLAVHPFPRAILLDEHTVDPELQRVPAADGLVALRLPARSIGTSAAPAPAHIVFPTFDAHAEPLLAPLSRARAAAGLLELTLHAPEPGPAAPLDLALALATGTSAWAARYRSSDEALALLERALAGRALASRPVPL